MPSPQRPTVRSRRIGSALRRLREEKDLTVRAVCRRTQRSPGWLSNIENGKQPIHPDDLCRFLDLYEVPQPSPLRESLMHLARQGRRKNWQRVREDRISPTGLDLASLEQDSASIRVFCPALIPGLLQIEEYARAVIETGLPGPTRDNEELLAFRLSRQPVLLQHNAPTFCAIVGESALRQLIGGPEVMRAQLRRLTTVGQMPNIELRVLPTTAGAHLWAGAPFDLISLKAPGRLTAAVVSQVIRTVFIEDEDEVSAHERVFEHLLSATLTEWSSLKLIERIAFEL
jgi:transcriptional regulator with XRE-family HTH domain